LYWVFERSFARPPVGEHIESRVLIERSDEATQATWTLIV
jgi:hypothetical protein